MKNETINKNNLLLIFSASILLCWAISVFKPIETVYNYTRYKGLLAYVLSPDEIFFKFVFFVSWIGLIITITKMIEGRRI